MDLTPKASPWKLPTPSSTLSKHAMSTPPGGNLSLTAWPKLPEGASEKSPSATSVSPTTLSVETCTPRTSTAVETASSRTSRNPTPRVRQGYSHILHPRPIRSFSQNHDLRTLLSFDSPTQQSKHVICKTHFSLPTAGITRQVSEMAHREQNDRGCSSQFEDISALLKAVQEDPRSFFNKLHSLAQENDELKGTMKSISEQLESERLHLKETIQNFENLQTIAKSKQVLLWKLIERSNSGEVSPHISTDEENTRLDNTDEDAGFRLLKGNRLENLNLDPSAQAFIPLAGTSPAEPKNKESSTASPGATPSQYPANSRHKAPVKAPATPTTFGSEITTFGTLTPPSPAVLEVISASIPPLFRTVCPFSLNGIPCPLTACQMKKLCPRFNNEQSGKSACDGKSGCRHLHERPTCIGEVDGEGCSYMAASHDARGKGKGKGRAKGKMDEPDVARKVHFKSKAHKHTCGREEWRLRLVVAGLRDVHKEGIYNK